MKVFKDVNEEKLSSLSLLKLKEVLWEITNKCDKNCKYCGSKNSLSNDNPSIDTITAILYSIVEYPPEIVTITGGEPGCLDIDVLDNVIGVLSAYGVKVRIVTNGRFLQYASHYKNFDKVEVIGLSVNEPWPYWFDYVEGHEKDLTIVTNFGTHNIWHFDKLAKFISDSNFNTWQIQLTMGEYMLQKEGIAYLREKIRSLNDPKCEYKVNYILSDNLQDIHVCQAGISSCSITANGEVVPCLSERSRTVESTVTIEGSLLQNSLKDIWENAFKEIRFNGPWCKSCRSCITYPNIDILTPTISSNNKPQTIAADDVMIDVGEVYREILRKKRDNSDDDDYPYRTTVVMYSTGRWGDSVVAYGVTRWNLASIDKHDNHFGK